MKAPRPAGRIAPGSTTRTPSPIPSTPPSSVSLPDRRPFGPEGEVPFFRGVPRVFLGAFLGVAGPSVSAMAGERPWFGAARRRPAGSSVSSRLFRASGRSKFGGKARALDNRRRPQSTSACSIFTSGQLVRVHGESVAWIFWRSRSRSPSGPGLSRRRRRTAGCRGPLQSFSIVSKEGGPAPRSIFETMSREISMRSARNPCDQPRALRRWRRFAPNRACSDTRTDPQMIRHRRLRDATEERNRVAETPRCGL